MKRRLLIILLCILSILGIFCYARWQNNESTPKEKYISRKAIEKVSKTTKIIIKNKATKENYGEITDSNTINEVINIIKSGSRKENEICNCDGTNIIFEMYKDNKLIDILYIWTTTADSTNERIILKSIEEFGCEYYSLSKDNSNLKSIIEKNSDLKFYAIYDQSEVCNSMTELIYEDDTYKYYFDCGKSDKVFIEFFTTNKKMTLKEAISNNYITAEEINKLYPNLLIRKTK